MITLSFMLAVGGVGLIVDVLRVSPDRRPFYRREGFWLIGFVSFVLLRGLGSHSLTDPWETHYGEVSREIRAVESGLSTAETVDCEHCARLATSDIVTRGAPLLSSLGMEAISRTIAG